MSANDDKWLLLFADHDGAHARLLAGDAADAERARAILAEKYEAEVRAIEGAEFEPLSAIEEECAMRADDEQCFVAHKDGTFTHGACTPKEIDIGSADVEVWSVGSDGWTAPIACSACGKPIDVVIGDAANRHPRS